MGTMPEPLDPLTDAIRQALAQVLDPEIRRPITELGMVRSIEVLGSHATVGIDLTTPGCPLKDTLTRDVSAAAATVAGIDDVAVVFGVMSAEQRAELRTLLRGTSAEPVIPFAQPQSLTKVFAIASGKGGVGKSSVTANLAVAMAADGLKVGVVDADIYGFS